MKWEDLSPGALRAMEYMGNLKPAWWSGWLVGWRVEGIDRSMCSAPVSFSASELREFAAAVTEVADWLDKRAEEEGK